jgi:hypothetical protein
MATCFSRKTWSGDRVYHCDPRHVGVIRAVTHERLAKIEWEDTGWISWLPLDSLAKVPSAWQFHPESD